MHRDGVLTVKRERIEWWPGVLWWLGGLSRRHRVDVSIAVPHAVAATLRLVELHAVSGRVTSAVVELGGSTDWPGRRSVVLLRRPVEADQPAPADRPAAPRGER